MSLQNNTASLTALLESVNALPDKVDTSGTATAADIYEGKTATVNDTKLTGTNPYNAANVDPQVTSILAALTEKGVDTTGAGLAEIAGLVESIQAGGGDIAFVMGSYTPATHVQTFTVTHGLGRKPKVAGYLKYAASAGSLVNFYACGSTENGYLLTRNSAGKDGAYTGKMHDQIEPSTSVGSIAYNPTSEEITFGNANTYGNGFAAAAYKWFVVG